LWRGVEAQHFVSTMKLVDSQGEQEELERILEASKPAPVAPPGQHYLLSTPFRYPSPHPSRFRPGGALGIWYGAESIETACTELAYWRWRFLIDSDGLRTTELIVEFSLFKAKVKGRCLDLSADPWDAHRPQWTADDYSACLTVAHEARARDVQWIRYWSARHVAGHCGAVLDSAGLVGIELKKQQTWVCKVSATSALMRHEQDSLSVLFESGTQ
jgi:RES domain